ncbi:uncharacterized protein LOC123512819 [Portunus trituberculatus]|uniref:uncharacterized protein LOC123512819 n=1 Tax=Portunus trituberculatus TaxID=210409 RepID=UPI001E1D03C2|nr:uncharacterized protein LOC123512819 [Portunus trituberculatus]XP_045125350.1 uncharacterized protein LOC123512819 [Portunus trituberculatus]
MDAGNTKQKRQEKKEKKVLLVIEYEEGSHYVKVSSSYLLGKIHHPNRKLNETIMKYLLVAGKLVSISEDASGQAAPQGFRMPLDDMIDVMRSDLCGFLHVFRQLGMTCFEVPALCSLQEILQFESSLPLEESPQQVAKPTIIQITATRQCNNVVQDEQASSELSIIDSDSSSSSDSDDGGSSSAGDGKSSSSSVAEEQQPTPVPRCSLEQLQFDIDQDVPCLTAQDTQQKRKRAASVSVRMQEPRVKRMMDFEEISEREEEDLEMVD